MSRPEGTNQCAYVSDGGTRCERGTLSEYCRKHRKALGLQDNGVKLAPEIKVTLDEIIEQVGRHVWEAAVEEALAKKKGSLPSSPEVAA